MIFFEVSRIFGSFGKVTPVATTLLLALLSVIPLQMPNALTLTPFLSLMAVYYWTIYRPDLLPPTLIFLIGLIQDGISGAYLGLTSLLFLGVYSFALSQRRLFLGKPFVLIWGGFLLTLIGTTAVTWGVVSLLVWRPVPFLQPALQFGTTFLLFPLVVWLFVWAHRHLLSGQ